MEGFFVINGELQWPIPIHHKWPVQYIDSSEDFTTATIWVTIVSIRG